VQHCFGYLCGKSGQKIFTIMAKQDDFFLFESNLYAVTDITVMEQCHKIQVTVMKCQKWT